MRRDSNLNYFRGLTSLVLFFSVLSGTFSIGKAQAKLPTKEKFATAVEADRDKTYAMTFRRGRGAEFTRFLTKTIGAGEAENVENWLDENNAGFFRTFDAAYLREAARFFEEKSKNNASVKSGTVLPPLVPKTALPVKRKPSVRTRGAIFDSSNNVFFQNVSYNALPGGLFDETSDESFEDKSERDDVTITKSETDDGIQMKASVAEKTKIVGDVTVTQGATSETRIIGVPGRDFGAEYEGVEFVETVNRKERTSLRTETIVKWRVLTASCPDADGISKGSGTMTVAVKKKMTTPQTIAILTRETTTRMSIKGFVNDAAELTHFDLEGTAVETISGYERAARLGLIDDATLADGTKQVNYQVKNNKPGKDSTNEYGVTKKTGDEMGEVKVTASPDVGAADLERINEISKYSIGWTYQQAAMYLEAAQSNWRNGNCVEVTLTAPKTKLLPAEKTEVSAETVHIHDKNKVNAELTVQTATESALPYKHPAVMQGTFTLTAPRTGKKAFIAVNSVSRRGIAFEILQFEEEKITKKPVPIPPKTTPLAKKCGSWSGKITAVKRKIESIVKPASGRLVREINNDDRTFSIEYYLPGIQDTSNNLANGYFADAKMNYRSVRYNESNYAPDEWMCDKTTIRSPKTHKMEIVQTAASDKRLTVYVSVGGEKGYLTFGSPEIKAEQIVTRTYETSCPSYDQANSGVDRHDRLIAVVNPSFEINFDLDAKSAYQLSGNKTIQNSDGSETIVTWSLTRDCR